MVVNNNKEFIFHTHFSAASVLLICITDFDLGEPFVCELSFMLSFLKMLFRVEHG